MPAENKFPNYVDLPRPTIFAHRGSSAHAPENTLAAFKLAVAQKAPAMELDVKLTLDHQLIVIHDQTVDRTTDGTGRIDALTLPELNKLDAGSHFDVSFRGEPIPTLAEVFEAVGDQIFINIELTNYSAPLSDLPAQVVGLVKKVGLESTIMFSSFNPIALIRAHRLLPEVPIGLLAEPGKPGAMFRSWAGNLIPHQALHPAAEDVSPALVQLNHRHDRRVHPYTVNQPEVMQRLITAGVDGFFTDDPLLAQKVISAIRS